MLRYLLLLTIVGINQGYLVKTKQLEGGNKNVTSDTELPGHYPLSSRKPVNEGPLPKCLDWRKKNAVSPVKNQLNCNACWAFSTVAAIESHVMIHTGAAEILSEQFLLDCDPFNKGCGEASLLDTYSHIVNYIGGVLRKNDYYDYEDRQSACRWRPPKNSKAFEYFKDMPIGNLKISYALPVPVIGYTRVKSDEDAMAEALYRFGPLTAGINSARMAEYNKNVIDEPTNEQCNPGTADHSVLIVGYNEYVPTNPNEPTVKYWIIKNSWGQEWGDHGYYYLVRGRNACGIANDVSLPFVSM